MPCDTKLKKGQTIAERAIELRKAAAAIDQRIAAGRVTVKVGQQGAVAFVGLPDVERDGMTDACIYRTLMRTGSAATRMAIARAEQMAGRAVDRRVVAQGVHSHDGGATWHPRG